MKFFLTGFPISRRPQRQLPRSLRPRRKLPRRQVRYPRLFLREQRSPRQEPRNPVRMLRREPLQQLLQEREYRLRSKLQDLRLKPPLLPRQKRRMSPQPRSRQPLQMIRRLTLRRHLLRRRMILL